MGDKKRVRSSGNKTKPTSRSASTSQVPDNPVGATGGSVTCSSCRTLLNDSDHCIQCDKCDLWNCLICANISENLYKAMTEGSYMNIKFFCTKCESENKREKQDGNLEKHDSAKIMTMLSKVLENQQSTTSQMKAFETQLNSFDTKLGNYESKIESIVESKVSQKFGQEAQELKAEIVDEVRDLVSERHEREIRECNLILFNAAEPTSTDKSECHMEDTQTFTDLCEELGTANFTANKIYRIGKKSGDKPRPLKVVLSNKTETKAILAAAKNLKSSSNEEIKAISIAPDYTPAQMKERKKLQQELEQRKEAGEDDLIIRNLKIVKKKIKTTQPIILNHSAEDDQVFRPPAHQ